MDLFVHDALSGEESVIEVQSDLSTAALHSRICQLLEFGDADLSIDGDAVDCNDTTGCISDIPSMAPGCCITATPNGRCYTKALKEGNVLLHHIPFWARQQPECAIAALSNRSSPTFLMPSLWGNLDVMTRAMKRDSAYFHCASAEVRGDKGLALVAVTKLLYHRLCDALRRDTDVVRAAFHVRGGPTAMSVENAVRCRRDIAVRNVKHAPAELRADKSFVIEALSLRQPMSLLEMSPSLRCDQDVLRTALTELRSLRGTCPLQQLEVCWALEAHGRRDVLLDMGHLNPACLRQASPELMADKAFVLQALELDGALYGDVHPTLQDDYEVALAAGGHCNNPRWLADKRFVSEIIRLNGPSVMYLTTPELQGDKDIVLPAVSQNPDVFECISPELQADRDVALAAVRGGLCLGDVQDPARFDRQVALEAVRRNPQNIRFTCDTLRDDKDIALAVVSHRGAEFFPWLGDTMRDDRDVALEAVRRSGGNFTFAGECVRGDKEVLLAAGSFAPLHQDVDLTDVAALVEAVAKDATLLHRVGPTLRNHKPLALAALKRSPRLYHRLEASMRSDPDIAKAGLVLGTNLRYMHDALRGNMDVVRVAVTQDGAAFRYASEELRADKDLALSAVKVAPGMMRFASEALRGDRDVLRQAFRNFFHHPFHEDQFRFVSTAIRGNREAMMEFARYYPQRVLHATPELLKDREFVLLAAPGLDRLKIHKWLGDKDFVLQALRCHKGTQLFRWASPELRGDTDVIVAALKGNKLNFAAATKKARYNPLVLRAALTAGVPASLLMGFVGNDRQLVWDLVAASASSFVHAKNSMKNDRVLVLSAVRSSPDSFAYAGDSLRNDRDTVRAALRAGAKLCHVGDALQDDKGIAVAAVRLNPQNIRFTCDALRDDKDIALAVVSHERAEFFPWLGDTMRDDRDIALEAVRRSGENFTFAGECVRDDKEVLLAALQSGGTVLLHCASPRLQSDDDVVRAAIASHPDNEHYAT